MKLKTVTTRAGETSTILVYEASDVPACEANVERTLLALKLADKKLTPAVLRNGGDRYRAVMAEITAAEIAHRTTRSQLECAEAAARMESEAVPA